MAKPKVLLYGAGAIGIVSNYEVAKANGFHISSALWGKDDLHVQPKVFKTIAEAASASGPFDYLIITTKAFPPISSGTGPSAAAEAIRPAISRSTTIVLIQNGIQIEDEYRSAYPSNTLLSCVVYLPSTQTSPGVVQMGNIALLQIGPYPSLPSTSTPDTSSDAMSRAQLLHDLVRSGGGTASVHANIQSRRWKKLMLNCGWNPVCALSRSRDVAFLASSPEAENFVRQVMLEVAGVAQKEGYAEIDAKSVEEQLQRAMERKGTRGIEPSMMADALGGRRMEVEAILGGVMRLGRKWGVDVTRLETLYVLAKALDDRIAEGTASGS